MKVRDWEVGRLIGESPKFRIYLGNKDDEQVIMKVAKTFEDNQVLADEAAQFNYWQAYAREINEFQAKTEGKTSHYDWLFAELISSFMEPTQADRHINVFRVPDVNAGNLTPLSKLMSLTRIDARTSVWILGRLFKIYSFYELVAIAENKILTEYPVFSPDDYLIEPARHRLAYYNFSGISPDVKATNLINKITQAIRSWFVRTWCVEAGTNHPSGRDEYDDDTMRSIMGLSDADSEDFDRVWGYFNLLTYLAENYDPDEGEYYVGEDTFEEAHLALYQKVGSLWGVGQYHPFTYCARNDYRGNWKTIEDKEG